MTEVGSKPKPLSKDERKELFLQFHKTRDPEIRNTLIEEHLYIADIITKKYTGKGIDYDDIYQVASLGLIYAVDRYDPEKGYEFSSFATPTIIGEIKKYFRDKGWTIRVPRRVQELSKKINLAKNHLYQEMQREPGIEDIADYLGVTSEEIIETMEASKVYTPQSLDTFFETESEDRDINLGDLIGEEEEYFDKIEVNDLLKKLFQNLTDQEKTIVIDRYFHKSTQAKTAKKLGISQMTVSRLEKRVLEKMRKEVEVKGIKRGEK